MFFTTIDNLNLFKLKNNLHIIQVNRLGAIKSVTQPVYWGVIKSVTQYR